MPLKSKHERCERCGKPVRMVTFISYYGVNFKTEGTARKQITGTLPSHGYCMACFEALAKRMGASNTWMRELKKIMAGSRPANRMQNTHQHSRRTPGVKS